MMVARASGSSRGVPICFGTLFEKIGIWRGSGSMKVLNCHLVRSRRSSSDNYYS